MGEPPIPVDEFKRRLLTLCLRSGGCRFPRRQRDCHIVLKGVSLALEPGKRYDQPAIDSRLRLWLAHVGRGIQLDHVNIRRSLVGGGYLGRTSDGSAYWREGGHPGSFSFDPAVDQIDVWRLARDGE